MLVRVLSLIAFLALLAPVALLHSADKETPARLRVYVGTYTGKNSKGIYRFDFDPACLASWP